MNQLKKILTDHGSRLPILFGLIVVILLVQRDESNNVNDVRQSNGAITHQLCMTSMSGRRQTNLRLAEERVYLVQQEAILAKRARYDDLAGHKQLARQDLALMKTADSYRAVTVDLPIRACNS